MFTLGKNSKRNLIGLHPALQFAVWEAIKISKVDFTVFEGLRTKEMQSHYVSIGSSWTMRSKHLSGNAVDIVAYVDGRAQWDNMSDEYAEIRRAMKIVILKHNLPISCGFDMWGKDEPHWQISSQDKSSWDIRSISKKIIKLIARR